MTSLPDILQLARLKTYGFLRLRSSGWLTPAPNAELLRCELQVHIVYTFVLALEKREESSVYFSLSHSLKYNLATLPCLPEFPHSFAAGSCPARHPDLIPWTCNMLLPPRSEAGI